MKMITLIKVIILNHVLLLTSALHGGNDQRVQDVTVNFNLVTKITHNQSFLRYLRLSSDTYNDDDDADDDVIGNEEDDDDDSVEESNGSMINYNINGDSCIPLDQCQLCHGGKRSGHAGCESTGKRMKYRCSPSGSSKSKIVYLPCKRTKMDEEYLMIRLQVICFLIAVFSLRAVRKEKMSSASLFDLRTRRRRQEMVPLNSNTSNVRGNSPGNGTNQDHGEIASNNQSLILQLSGEGEIN